MAYLRRIAQAPPARSVARSKVHSRNATNPDNPKEWLRAILHNDPNVHRSPLTSVSPMDILMASFLAIATLGAGCSPSRPQAQAAEPAQLPAIEFVGEWGVHGQEPGQLDHPVGPAVDAAGRVYLADRGTGFVQKFAADGTALLSFEDSAVREASAIAVDSGGGIYVANVRAGEIRVFFPEGDLLRVFHVTPQRGFGGPYSFTVSTDGRLFVPDPAGGKIEVLSRVGRLEKVWKVAIPQSSANQQAEPVATAAAPDGFVYVGEARTGRIVKFSGQGEQVAEWAATASSAAHLVAVAVSPKYVFALRDASPRLQIWTLNGQPVLSDDLGGRLAETPVDAVSGEPASRNSASRDRPSPSRTSLDRESQDRTPDQAASMAVNSRDELVILDPAGTPGGPRILRFRIHLDSGRPLQ
jgi:hypothetical protein